MSQGYGSHKYAHAAAQQYVDTAQIHSIEAEVVCGAFDDHDVTANCTPESWTVLKAKPGQSLREWIKSCWLRGVNPRVYMPFLPYEIEEKLDLD